jgi:prepilin-type N-terminal cleavage/methylation domain-containing protein
VFGSEKDFGLVRGGFTLIEVVVSSVLLLVVLAALTHSLSYVRRTAYSMEKRLACIHTGRGVMEQFRAMPFNDSRLAIAGNKRIPESITMDEEFREEARYTVTRGVPINDIKIITVELKWAELTGGQGTVSLTTKHSRVLH